MHHNQHTSDPDEQYDIALCQNIRELIKQAEEKGANMIQLNVHDCWIKEDGSIEEQTGDFYKNLIFKYSRGVHYKGQIHETLIPPKGTPWKALRAPPHYFYRHIKSHWIIWRNGCRNMFCCGAGDNLMEKNPYWVELRAICSVLGIENWKQFNTYLQKGNIDRRLKEWILRYRKLDDAPWHSELRDVGHYYFDYLHPEEDPEKDKKYEITHWQGQPPIIIAGGISEFIAKLRKIYRETLRREPSRCEVEYFWSEQIDLDNLRKKLESGPDNWPLATFIAQQYWEILQREVDASGFQTYMTLISLGKIRREQLASILYQSSEYSKIEGR